MLWPQFGDRCRRGFRNQYNKTMYLRKAPRALFSVFALLTMIVAAPAGAESQTSYLRQLLRTEASPPSMDEQRDAIMRDSVVALARQQIGTRYRWGGSRPAEGFDCSGLIAYITSSLNLQLPRTAALQARIGREIPKRTDALRPGDLVTFGRGTRIEHIGIYVGDGRYIHASTTAGRVIESTLVRPPHPRIRPWQGVRRLVFGEGSG
jgi:cell wall-associated NlpC family hydrolase